MMNELPACCKQPNIAAQSESSAWVVFDLSLLGRSYKLCNRFLPGIVAQLLRGGGGGMRSFLRVYKISVTIVNTNKGL